MIFYDGRNWRSQHLPLPLLIGDWGKRDTHNNDELELVHRHRGGVVFNDGYTPFRIISNRRNVGSLFAFTP